MLHYTIKTVLLACTLPVFVVIPSKRQLIQEIDNYYLILPYNFWVAQI